MSASSELTAYSRELIGKSSRRLAHQGQIPAVLYGSGRDAKPIAVDRHAFELFAAHHAAHATVVELTVEGEKKPIHAMVRDVQHSAVKGSVLHIDFQVVSMNKVVHAAVAIHLVNDPAGVKSGGVLTVNMHEINVEAKPGDLPEVIEWDVSALEVGDTLHVGDIVVPEGVTLLDEPDTIIASVQAPRAEVEEEVVVEAAEPEVIGKPAEEE